MKPKKKSSLKLICFWGLIVLVALYNPLSARVMTLTAAFLHRIEPGVFYNMVAAESSFNSLAVSRKNAIGLGQVRVETAKYIIPYYIQGMLWFPPTNLHIAAVYYKYLLNRYSGNHSLSLAAYNWGETNVDIKLRQEGLVIDRDSNYREMFINVPETYHYISRIIDD